MRKKITASFDELMRDRYGSTGGTRVEYSLSLDDLFAGYYGIPPAPKKTRRGRPAVVLSCHVDDGQTMPQRPPVRHPREIVVQQSRGAVGRPYAPVDVEGEYRVEIIDPAKDAAVPAPPAPPAAAASTATDDDFAADLQSILAGKRVFDPATRTTVDTGQSGAPPPAAPRPTDETAIFDRIAQSLQYANAYNLGSIELENRFADFDTFAEIEKKAAKAEKSGDRNIASSAPPALPAVSGTDFLNDLEAIRAGFSQKAGGPPAAAPAPPGQPAVLPAGEPAQGDAAATTARALTQPAPLSPPSTRPCCVFGENVLHQFLNIGGTHGIVEVTDLNSHRYDNWLKEQNGISYTCRGGFIDSGHVRDIADRTAYLAVKAHELLPKGGVSRQFPNEGGVVEVEFHAQNVTSSGPAIIVPLAQRIAYELGLWHEIWSWCVDIQRYSAFAPEDLYSNLVGTWVAAHALSQMSIPRFDVDQYNTVMGSALPLRLAMMRPVSAAETQKALDIVDISKNPGGPGWWDSSKVNLLPPDFVRRRNVNGTLAVKPWLVPGTGFGCDGTGPATPLLVPGEDGHGTALPFYYTLRVTVNTAEIPAKFLPNPANIQITSKDFEAIVNNIRADVVSQFPNGDKP